MRSEYIYQCICEIAKTTKEIGDLMWQNQPMYYQAQAFADLSSKLVQLTREEFKHDEDNYNKY